MDGFTICFVCERRREKIPVSNQNQFGKEIKEIYKNFNINKKKSQPIFFSFKTKLEYVLQYTKSPYGLD